MLANYAAAAHWEVDPARLDLVDEFRRSPRGPHSADLQKLLHRMRWAGDPDLEGRYVILVLSPHQLALAILPRERGKPAQPLADQMFTSIRAAEWEVFKRRWRALTGHDAPDAPGSLPA